MQDLMIIEEYTKTELTSIKKYFGAIEKAIKNGNKSAWDICKNLANLKNEAKGKDFVNICESLGYAKSTAYKFVQVSEYLDALELDSTEWTVSKISELLPLNTDMINELIKDGEITKEMSCRELRDKVKSINYIEDGIEYDTETDETEQDETDETETEQDETDEENKTERDKEIVDWLLRCPILLDTETHNKIKKILGV